MRSKICLMRTSFAMMCGKKLKRNGRNANRNDPDLPMSGLKNNAHPQELQLMRFVSGRINEVEKHFVKAHLTGCSICQTKVRAMRNAMIELSAQFGVKQPNVAGKAFGARAQVIPLRWLQRMSDSLQRLWRPPVWGFTVAAVAMLVAVALVSPGNRARMAGLFSRKQPEVAQPGLGNERRAVQLALASPLNEVLRSDLLVTMLGGQPIELYCPLRSTKSLTPPIVWKPEGSKNYDISIRDQLDEKALPLAAKALRPPVEFAKVKGWEGAALKAGGLYKLRLSEQGNPLSTSEYDFTVRQGGKKQNPAASPKERIDRARRLLTEGEPCFGDALAELLSLRPEEAGDESVLRMKLVAFGRLGLKEDYDQTVAALRKLVR